VTKGAFKLFEGHQSMLLNLHSSQKGASQRELGYIRAKSEEGGESGQELKATAGNGSPLDAMHFHQESCADQGKHRDSY
jgi:hypothetical protein